MQFKSLTSKFERTSSFRRVILLQNTCSMDLKSIRVELDRVVKHQELSATYYHHLIDKIHDEIKQAISDLQSAGVGDTSTTDHKSVIERLQEKLKMLKKDLKIDHVNDPETLGNFVEIDISKANIDVKFDSQIVNQIILNLLFHEGLFDVAKIFIKESQGPEIIPKLDQILEALKAKDLEPAVNWMCANRQILDESGSNLEFDLRGLQFLELLKEDKSEAVYFALTYLSPFSTKLSKEFKELMLCLRVENLETSPYSDLVSPEKWAAVSHEFMVQFCGGSIGKSGKDPLAVTVEAGAQALSSILEFTSMPETETENKEELAAMEESPVPGSWEESDEDRNPPTTLPFATDLGSLEQVYAKV